MELPATLLFDHPSTSSIASHVASELSSVPNDDSLTADVLRLTSKTHATRTRPEHDEAPVELI